MEILKGFVWDIQRFASSTVSAVLLSEIETAIAAYSGTRAASDVVGLNGSGDVEVVASASAGSLSQAFATLGDTTSARPALTLDNAVTGIITDGKVWGAITAGNIASGTLTVKDDTASEKHSFTITKQETVTISAYNATTGYTLTSLASTAGLAVTKGTVKFGLAGTSATVVKDGANSYTLTATQAGDGATITKDSGITDVSVSATKTLTVATGASALKVLTDYTLTGTAVINANKELEVGSVATTTVVATSKELTLIAGNAVTINGQAVEVSTGGEVSVTTASTNTGVISAITGLDSTETVHITNLPANATLSVNGTTTFKNQGTAGNLMVGNFGGKVGIVSGTIQLTENGSVNEIVGTATAGSVATAAGLEITYTKGANGNGVEVNFTGAANAATVTGLDKVGEIVKVGAYEYKLVSDGVVKQTNTTSGASLFHTCTPTTQLDYDGLGASDITASMINLDSITDTKYYTTLGLEVSSDDEYAVEVKGGSTPKVVTVSDKAEGGINLRGVTATVTDKGTDTQYTTDGTSTVTFKADNTTFTSTNGVISDTKGTIVLDQTTSAIVAKGSVSVDATTSTEAKAVTYEAGTDVTGAKITLNKANDSYITLTETNSGSDAVATVLDMGATNKLTGVDGNATVKLNNVKNTDLATITTTGSGTFTVGNTSYVVADDSNGVEFGLSGTADTLATIAGLAKDATVTVSGKFENADIRVGADTTAANNERFQNVSASNGITFTSTDAAGNATATFYAKGDTVTTAAGKYEVLAMGNSSDGIVIGDNSTSQPNFIGSLNDGDYVKLTTATGTFFYEVSNNILTATEYNSTTSFTETTKVGVTTYTLSDGESGFSVYDAGTTGNWKVLGGDKGETLTGALTLGTTGSTASTQSIVNGMYVNSNGEISSSDTKAVGQLSVTDETITYQALTDKAQTVGVTGDSSGKENWVINTRGGKDTITYTATTDASINSGAGADAIVASTASRANDLLVDAGEGKDRITVSGLGNTTVNAGAGNDTIYAGLLSTDTAEYLINLDSGDNEVTHTGRNGNATIVGGAGKDTIKAAGLDDVVSGGDGADTFNVSQSSMTINDYTYGTDVLQAASVAGAITVTPTNFGADGVVSIASGVTADVSRGTGTGDFYAVSLVDSTGKNKQNVAWAKEGGSTIDITTYDQAVTLIGDADGKNALYAGTKADTIYSYADSDSVYGGAGKDTINLVSGTGRVVGVATTSSKDTVSGFKASFEEGDSIYMVDGSASDVKVSFANNNVTFKDGEGSLQLNNVATNSTTGAVELNVSGAKVALAAASVGGAIAADSTSYANFYMGNGAAVSFAAAEGEVNVDLRNGLDSGAEGAKFSGITAVTGGAGNNTLIGSTAADSIYAGTGASSLWGGAGKDSLIGSTASDAFFIGAGDGSDVVTNFSAAGNENADTVYALNDITGAKLTSNGVEISVGDTDKLTLKNVTADTAIKFNSNGNAGVAKVGSATTANNFSYDSTVTYYGGGNKSDKIAFASGSTENAQIWLDGSQGKAYASIDVVDGANTSGNLLVAGDSSSQSIIGGKGDSSLWGGAGSVSDTLRSSSGSKTMFWWGAGEGNDLVVSASADDSVNLYNLKLSDVDVANSSITNSGVSLALNDGSKLTVQTSRDMTFSIDGQSWTAQHSSKEWKQNS